MAVRYQKARGLIAGSVAAAVIIGTAYFAQPQTAAGSSATTASTPSQAIQANSPATTVKQPIVTTTKAKKSRGS
ncbi:MAG: hypothetical protein AB7J35_03450 [Dehalococcoidia bacterium]